MPLFVVQRKPVRTQQTVHTWWRFGKVVTGITPFNILNVLMCRITLSTLMRHDAIFLVAHTCSSENCSVLAMGETFNTSPNASISRRIFKSLIDHYDITRQNLFRLDLSLQHFIQPAGLDDLFVGYAACVQLWNKCYPPLWITPHQGFDGVVWLVWRIRLGLDD